MDATVAAVAVMEGHCIHALHPTLNLKLNFRQPSIQRW